MGSSTTSDDTKVVFNQTISEVRKYIRRKLGSGELGVDVELDDMQCQDAIESAMMWWGGLIGWYAHAKINIAPGGGEFDVPDDCEAVSHVFFDETQDVVVDVFSWVGGGYRAPFYGGPYRFFPTGSHSYAHQVQDYYQEAQKVAGTDPDWEYRRDTRKLIIYRRNEVDPSTGGMQVEIRYQLRVPDISKLHPYEFDLVRRYALADGMETLGNIRTKWSSIPTAQGESSLNGDVLLTNAESLKAELEEKAKAYRRPIEFFAY